jgi:hypothetical protein
VIRGPVRCDHCAVWQQFSGVVEYHYAIAEQAPALLRVADYRVRGLAVW